MSKIDTLKEEGNKHFKNEDFAKAIKCYLEGLQLEPKNSTLNCNLSQAHLAMGDFVEAEVHAVVTLAQQNDSVKAFYRAAKAAFGMMKRERALMYLKVGLANCPKADELKTLFEEINRKGELPVNNSAHDKVKEVSELNNNSKKVVNDVQSDKRGAICKDNNNIDDKNKVRSRSCSSSKRSSNQTSKNVTTASSLSDNKLLNSTSKSVTAVKPEKDKFVETLLQIKSELLPEERDVLKKKREALIQMQQKLSMLMKDGSEALLSGLARQASEKYKTALDIITENNLDNFGLLEIDRIVLKYSLSTSWIQTLNYNNIVQSITYLSDIELNHAAKLPAVYFGLGNAYYKLNRFKIALQHLDKGFQVVDKNFKVTPHPWPGTMHTIFETTKSGLQESVNKLIHECKTYREPDAICRYKECLTVSVHINPSNFIFYSDPDFVGFVVLICEENCKITYHIGCWKHYKDSVCAVGKLSDKEMLGRACLTSDCIFEGNRQSVIICIEVYGEDGKIKTSCLKEPTKTDNVNEHRKEKKKKNEKFEKSVKIKPTRTRVRRITPQNAKREKLRSTNNEFLVCLQRLIDMRTLNFGFVKSMQWNPKEDYFGRSDIASIKTYLPDDDKDSESLKETKDFIFTYFYEYLKDEGPKKFSVVENKWIEEVSQFPGIDFISKHDGICEFLLQSYRFASIDDNLCLSSQLSSVYQDVLIEMEQSATFVLSCSDRSIEDELAMQQCLTGDDGNDTPSHSSPDVAEPNLPSTSSQQIPTESNSKFTSNASHVVLLNDNNYECDSPVSDMDDFILGSSSDEVGSLNSDDEYDDFDCEDDYEDDDNDGNDNDFLRASKDINNCDTSTRDAKLPEVTDKAFQSSNNSNPILVNSSYTAHNSLDSEKKDRKIESSSQYVELKSAAILSKDKHSPNVQVITNDNVTQTETDNELETLKKENMRLKLQVQIINDDKRNTISDFQKKMDEYLVKIQELERKMLKIADDKEKAFNDYQKEISKKDTKYDITVKKHKEEMDSLRKKKEEDSVLLKKTLESLGELNKEDCKKTNTIERLEIQLRKSNEEILNLRKILGENKLDIYLAKCKERIDTMNFMMKYAANVSLIKMNELKTAVHAWQSVAGELKETRDLLPIQYDILAQQLKTKVSPDNLFQLELAQLPKEPNYPLEDFTTIINILQTFVENNIIGQLDNRNSHINSIQPSGTSPFTEPSGSCGILGSNFFPDHPSTSSFHQFMKPLSNENGSSNLSRIWNSSVPENTNASFAGTSINSSFQNHRPNYQPLKPFQDQSFETLSVGNSELNAVVKQGQAEKKFGSVGEITKSATCVEEKKSSSSSSSGLTLIEISSSFSKQLETKKRSSSSKLWSYKTLMEELLKHFKKRSEVELGECLAVIREKNGNKLSGLPVLTIIRRVEKVLEEKCNKTIGNMGMDKFGGAAWSEVKDKSVIWVNDDVDKECIICHVSMESQSMTMLQCKHAFHTECVRTWLHTSSTCPICRKYTCLADEFPPLA